MHSFCAPGYVRETTGLVVIRGPQIAQKTIQRAAKKHNLESKTIAIDLSLWWHFWWEVEVQCKHRACATFLPHLYRPNCEWNWHL